MSLNSTTKVVIGHRLWVKLTHWIGTISFLLLLYTGVTILKAHPRLYWGDAGNDLTPALFELPISKNYKHGGWENKTAFYETKDSPVSASRTFDIYNQNGWGRSLHFLSAWVLVFTGIIYLLFAIFSGHIKRHLWLKSNEFSLRLFLKDMADHLRLKIVQVTGGPQYGPLQKTTYLLVLFLLIPLIILTGLTMSPAVTAAYPFLLKIFFGAQSARTIHFFAAALLTLFLLVHIIMIIRTGFKKQMISMTIGK